MNTVGHQAPAQQAQAMAMAVIAKDGEVARAAVIGEKEDVLPVVASLRNVVGDARCDESGSPRHEEEWLLRARFLEKMSSVPFSCLFLLFSFLPFSPGPGQFDWDVPLAKTTKVGGLREDATLQFRSEFFNLFNHPQFNNPAVAFDSPASFGQINGLSVNPRFIQFGLKYVF